MNTMLNFGGKVVLVTCATSGLRRATAIAFARAGAAVTMVGRREARLQPMAA
jgi:NADP-dependent 3-hydroxy acid dehydrogenase YdfG